MKRIAGIGLAVIVVLLTVGCGGAGSAAAEAEEAVAEQPAAGIPVENAFYYRHVDGHKHETDKLAFVLFEYEQLRTVRYQVAYIMCTCRSPDVNYYSVAFVELDKNDGSVVELSYEQDTTDHYIAGLYGDSETSYDGTPVKEIFYGFLDQELVGASQEEILAMEAMHGAVDGFTGATVTPNNAVRMLHGLFDYHNTRYM